jgi:hypothetical protein
MSRATPNLAGAEGFAGARRVEGWAGEVRLNLVRLAAVILFYGYHLVNVYGSRDNPELAGAFHVKVTALVMVWSVGVVVLWLYLSRRWVPPALKYAVTAWDTVLITTLLVLAGGPRGPLVVLYFLAIAASPLRLSLRLVYTATLLALAAYGFLLGHYAFYVVGYERYYHTEPALQIPRTQEVIFALGLVTAGVLAGQVVRQARRLIGHADADVGADAREAEVRLDTKLVAAGLALVAVLVAAGLLFSAILGPRLLGSYSALPILAVIGILFVIAVAAALAEVYQAGRPAPQDRTPGS